MNKIEQIIFGDPTFSEIFDFLRDNKSWFMEYIREAAIQRSPLKLIAHNQQMEQVHKTFIKMALANLPLVDIWLSKSSTAEDDCFGTLLLSIKNGNISLV